VEGRGCCDSRERRDGNVGGASVVSPKDKNQPTITSMFGSRASRQCRRLGMRGRVVGSCHSASGQSQLHSGDKNAEECGQSNAAPSQQNCDPQRNVNKDLKGTCRNSVRSNARNGGSSPSSNPQQAKASCSTDLGTDPLRRSPRKLNNSVKPVAVTASPRKQDGVMTFPTSPARPDEFPSHAVHKNGWSSGVGVFHSADEITSTAVSDSSLSLGQTQNHCGLEEKSDAQLEIILRGNSVKPEASLGCHGGSSFESCRLFEDDELFGDEKFDCQSSVTSELLENDGVASLFDVPAASNVRVKTERGSPVKTGIIASQSAPDLKGNLRNSSPSPSKQCRVDDLCQGDSDCGRRVKSEVFSPSSLHRSPSAASMPSVSPAADLSGLSPATQARLKGE
jgi:hypothetical protein